ncbi:MAG: hypothetical protein HUJ25_07860 [Crocinitomicaceae bacterium]|nr:hypothetical protein [Crocinitomicaceae bacterium]
MKTRYILVLITLISLFSLRATAQFKENNSIYANFGYRVGTFKGPYTGFSWIVHQKLSFHFNYRSLSRKSTNIPTDYNPGLGDALASLLSFGLAKERIKDYSREMSFGVGYSLPLNKKKTIRFHPKIHYTQFSITEPGDWEYDHSASMFDPNYTYRMKRRQAQGFTLNASLEFPFSQAFGITIDPHATLLDGEISGGCMIGVMIGLLHGTNPKNK